jgi:hypothetical protein
VVVRWWRSGANLENEKERGVAAVAGGSRGARVAGLVDFKE